MNSEFKKCPSCGTRNFADDSKCGVCGHRFTKEENHQPSVTDNKSPQKNNYYVLALVIGAIAILYFYAFKKEGQQNHDADSYESAIIQSYQDAETSPSAEGAVTYAITDIVDNKRFFNLSVKIDHKLSNDELIALSYKVKTSSNLKSKTGVIFFHLPEMRESFGAWAKVIYDPNPTVRIIGNSIEDENTIRNNSYKIKDFVGLWYDNGTQGDVLMRIRKDANGNYWFEYIDPKDPKPSDLADRLNRTSRNGHTVYVNLDAEEVGEYYVIEKNGDLTAYDRNGFIFTYRKLK